MANNNILKELDIDTNKLLIKFIENKDFNKIKSFFDNKIEFNPDYIHDNNYSIVKYALENKCDINIIELLLKNKCNIHLFDNSEVYNTELEYSIQFKQDIEIVKLLLEYQANIDHNNYFSLYSAFCYDLYDIIDLLISKLPDNFDFKTITSYVVIKSKVEKYLNDKVMKENKELKDNYSKQIDELTKLVKQLTK